MNLTWEEAVKQKLILNFIDWYYMTPLEALDCLISHEVAIALDPAVSKEARELRDSCLERYLMAKDRVLELEAACEAVIEWWKREGMAKMNYGAPNCIFRVQDALAGKIK